MRENIVIVTGYSKAPQNTVMYQSHKFMGMILEIDRYTHEIVDVEVTVITKLVKDFFKEILVGINIIEELDEGIKRIENNYFAPSQTAMIAALKNCWQRYCDSILNNKSEAKEVNDFA